MSFSQEFSLKFNSFIAKLGTFQIELIYPYFGVFKDKSDLIKLY